MEVQGIALVLLPSPTSARKPQTRHNQLLKQEDKEQPGHPREDNNQFVKVSEEWNQEAGEHEHNSLNGIHILLDTPQNTY